MDKAQLFESQFTGTHGSELFFQVWSVPNPRGYFLITHGQAEHTDCYSHVAQFLNQKGWEVIGWDLRGHGHSEGKRGYVGDFLDYVTDLKHLVQHLEKDHHFNNKAPLVIFGHSLGGLITLKCLVDYPNLPVTACCLSSPALGFAIQVPPWKDKAAHILSKWLPEVTLGNEIKYSDLTRDVEKIKAYERDPLRHDRISSRVYLGMQKYMVEMAARANEIRIPLLLQIAGHDRIVNSKASVSFFEKLASTKKQLIVYEDSYHEIVNDLDRDLVLKQLGDFLHEL